MTDQSPPFVVLNPDGQFPFIFNSPHSGRDYPADFLAASQLDAHSIRKSEDSFVDELFSPVVDRGATLMHALFPRAYVDLNREPFELDPHLFDETLPDFANTNTTRVMSGLGTIARVVTENEEIYKTAPSLDEALERINTYYFPYHRSLRGLIDKAAEIFGYAVLLDCHSMPSLSTVRHVGHKPDFILGDRYGTSCDGEIMQVAEDILRDLGYFVVRNVPYAGGFATEHYGKPNENVHALQIEVNRALYMDETNFVKSENFDHVRDDLNKFCFALMDAVSPILEPQTLAAE